jgi:thiol-disulfide isomerase/thioredoxin
VKGELMLGRLGVALAVVCATTVTATSVAIAMPSVRTTVRNTFGIGPAAPKPSYAVGETVDLPSEVYAQAPHTLAIFFRSDCGACERMKPFLQRLAARNSGAGVRVIAIAAQASRENTAFARQIGLDERHLITMDVTKLRVSQVPSFVLVDQSGRIQTAIEGIPSPQDQEELLRRVTAFSQSH